MSLGGFQGGLCGVGRWHGGGNPMMVVVRVAENRKKKYAGTFHVNSTCVASNLCQKSSEY